MEAVEEIPMFPVLKWAGGKTQLLDILCENIPPSFGCYYEPFLGGGALLWRTAPERVVVNDASRQLINLYAQIRDNAEEFIHIVEELDSAVCTSDFYYHARDRYNQKIAGEILDTECAAYMLWINKHCFNGLYRTNKKGLFNVPYNNSQRIKSFSEDNIRRISEYLKTSGIKMICGDFEEACSTVKPDDFVYFDSPYVPEGGTADFTAYTKDGFSLDDHARLAKLFRRLDSQGTKVMLSNNDVPLVRDLYEGFHFQSIDVKRMINRDASKRKGKEVLITNYHQKS